MTSVLVEKPSVDAVSTGLAHEREPGVEAPEGRVLPELAPEFSASTILDRRQRRVLGNVALILLALLVIAPLPTLIALMTLSTIVYASTVVHRMVITRRSLRSSPLIVVSDEEARAVPTHELPVYTVLVPMYREAAVVPTLLASLRSLDYPAHLLDVKLLLEADDEETIAAARQGGGNLEIVLVPPGGPRTKPNALNYGLREARGELVTIFDAEDHPDPLQLRRVAAAFRRLPADVVCLQAQLVYHNADQNIITRWFTIEYLMWFSLFLPGLSSTNAPVPLGGTSNHIRRDVLEVVGAWDPYNVTEDADLGIRLHRVGLRTAVIESITYEEANSDFVNWMKQRSRWYKGYLQTWLVHLRHPVKLWRALGPGGFVQFNLFVGGTPLLALVNSLFWTLTLFWFIGKAEIIQRMFPAPLYHVALFCWIVGNVAVVYLTVLAARRSGRYSLVWVACLVPVYWVMMSMAAIKAFWQILTAPSYWEKTTHGLTTDVPAAVVLVPDHVEVQPEVPGALGSPDAMDSEAPISWQAQSAAALHVAPYRFDDAASGNGNGHGLNGDGVNGNGRNGAVLPPVEFSTAGLETSSAVTDRASRRPAGHLRSALLGRRLQYVGLLIVAFVAYLVLGTGWRTDHAQAELRHSLATASSSASLLAGDPVGVIRAPAAGIDSVIVEGAGSAQLDRGPGHVVGSATPGADGHVVIVGHRLAAGGPFAHVDRLHRGDRIDITAPWGHARYRVTQVETVASAHLKLAPGGRPRLTLVTSSDGVNVSDRSVVQARLESDVIPDAPEAADVAPSLPGTDWTAIGVLAVSILGGLFVWRLRKRLPARWGPVGRAGLVLPVVLLAVYVGFASAAHALPALL